jgi:hypothetical protein
VGSVNVFLLRINGTSAPATLANAAISSSSVDTITLSNKFDCNAASIEYKMIGLPQKDLMFLRGIRLLPPRAGMIHKLFNVEKSKNFFNINIDLQKKNSPNLLYKLLKKKNILPDIIINNLGGDLNLKEPLMNYNL